MKIFVDCMPLSAGGGVQVAIAFLENLRRGGAPFLAALPESLLTALPAALGEARDAGQIRTFPKRSAIDIVLAGGRLRSLERAFKPDVTFTVFGPAYFRARSPHLVGFALPNLIYPREGTFAGGRATRLTDALRRRLFQRADHLVVETEAAKRRLADLLGRRTEDVTVIGNSVNPFLRLCAARPIPSQSALILVPSAYYPHKNLEFVPEVARSMKEGGRGDAVFQLTLDPASPAWRALVARASELGVGEMVTTLGIIRLDALAEAYQQARLVFLPTLREVSTAVFPEAFQFRRPLVTSDLDFARELCGAAAEYIPPHDARRTAAALVTLLTDQRRAEELMKAGDRQLVSGYPTPEHKFELQMALLERVAAGGRRGS